MPGNDREAVTRSLCLAEMAPWLAVPVGRSRAEEAFRVLNDTVRSVFVYRIADGTVELLDKPAFKVREHFHDSSQAADEAGYVFLEELIRARMYRHFFQRVLAASGAAADTVVAVDVNDAPIAGADAPVFAFQKTRGGRTVLLPDVDFLHSNFYIPGQYRDATPYLSKSPRAIFAGSTTGGRTITAEDVRALAIARLRAGVHFKGSDLVDFRLPNIVQCESAEVERLVADLGVNRSGCTWAEQFGHRFILSMDGNGATCSRVAIGLRSQSALVKYESDRDLYYFGALLPWRHFIPVRSDDEVASIVLAERREPGIFASVASAGRTFAHDHLSRAGVCAYMAELLALHASVLGERPPPRAIPTVPDAAPSLVESGAHIQGRGDVWGWPGEWVGEVGSGRAVEGIMLAPEGLPDQAIAVRAVLDDGSVGDWVEGRGFCGTRGQDRPLRGFEVQLREPWSASLRCSCRAFFVDGSAAGPMSSGEVCRAETGAALEAFEILVTKAHL